MLKRTISSLFLAVSLTALAQTPADSVPQRPVINVDSLTAGARPMLHPLDFYAVVYTPYTMTDSLSLDDPMLPEGSALTTPEYERLLRLIRQRRSLQAMRHRYIFANPLQVRYNEASLPEPPQPTRFELDPMTARLSIVEDVPPAIDATLDVTAPEIRKRHWIRSFDGLLQFSQAYLSPNWYQGGNNSLTMLFNTGYGVKLNQTFHPNLLCEMSVRYKLNINSTPEDQYRDYNISEDLFQFNGKFGFKAWRNWFYSVTAVFKTQFFHNYEVNSPNMRAAFLSPGELNVGIGMTWDKTNEKKTFTINASISPLSWNMKTCVNGLLNPESFGIKNGRRVQHELGSNLEVKWEWKLRSNITYKARVFAFTDYRYAQGDWENTFSFAITRFLSTQLYVHLRYDSTTPRIEDSKWGKWQLKEILSFGFSYTFATI